MDYKRVLTVQDISCLGQCSMTVALPIISACGQETVVLPSKVLSTHTGGLGAPHTKDLSDEIPGILDHWAGQNFQFDTVYTGYLGSTAAIGHMGRIFGSMVAEGGKKIVDPAMADHGKLYGGLNVDYATAMWGLCRQADIVIPNVTEAAMIAGMPYREEYDERYIFQLVERLNVPCLVLTGVGYTPEETGVLVVEDGSIRYHSHRKINKRFHGTGDIFASAFVGALTGGKALYESAVIASEFTKLCIEKTSENPAHSYGVKFEPCLGQLMEMLK